MPLQPLALSVPEAEAEALRRDGEMGAIDSARRRRREGGEGRAEDTEERRERRRELPH